MHQLVDLRLRILPEPRGRERAIVPVISEDETIKAERIARDSGIDGPATAGVDLEGLTPAPSANLILLAAADEIVFVRIEGE